MVHKLAIVAVIGLTASAVCMGAAAAIGGNQFGRDFDGIDLSMFGDRPRSLAVAFRFCKQCFFRRERIFLYRYLLATLPTKLIANRIARFAVRAVHRVSPILQSVE